MFIALSGAIDITYVFLMRWALIWNYNILCGKLKNNKILIVLFILRYVSIDYILSGKYIIIIHAIFNFFLIHNFYCNFEKQVQIR